MTADEIIRSCPLCRCWKPRENLEIVPSVDELGCDLCRAEGKHTCWTGTEKELEEHMRIIHGKRG